MTIRRAIAVIMVLDSSLLTAWASGDIAFPAILGMLGLLGVLRRFTWDIRPERHFIAPLLLLLLAILFALHCRYAHVRADQAAAFAWQTIARYFLASMVLILFLRPHRTKNFGFRPRIGVRGDMISDFGLGKAGDANPQSAIRNPQSIGLPPSLGLFHLASAMAAGQVLLLDDRYVAFRLSELLSVILVLLYGMVGSVSRTRAPAFEGGTPSTPRGQDARDTNGRSVLSSSYLPTFLRSYLRSSYPSPILGFVFVLLLVAVNLGWVGGSLLYRHVEIINFLPAWLSRGTVALEATTAAVSRVGFVVSGKLSNVLLIKEDADASPVLSITGDSNPMYLRAAVFETYSQSAWHDLSYKEAISPEQNTPLGSLLVSRMSLFRLRNEDGAREVTVRHEAGTNDNMFLPLGTCSVEAPFNLLMRDDDDIVTSPNMRSRLSYRAAYTPGGGRPPSGNQLRRMRALPSQLDPRIGPKAKLIFRNCTTTAQKIDAVTKYFHTTYTYALGLEIPAEQDALNYFLLQASTGYCEYFASGAAVLLRLAGVPTRYVTGFLVTEQGDDRHTWVARNMDAHAWAEAWDQERGQWTIVEATTQEGLDELSLADELARGAGAGAPFLRRLVQSVYEYGLFGVIGGLFMSHGLATGVVLALVFLSAAFWVARRRRRRPESAGPRPVSAEVLALHGLLAAMDRKVQALGYRRHREETLHAFANRIYGGLKTTGAANPQSAIRNPQSVADWYLAYAGLRYCRAVGPSRLEQLQQAAEELR
jgi:hypothetical protein